VDEGAISIMADQLITGTTLVEKESRSAGDIVVGGIIEFDDTYSNVPSGFLFCDGTTVNDPLSVYNGSAVPNLNTQYWSCPGAGFLPYDLDGSTGLRDAGTEPGVMFEETTTTEEFYMPVYIPEGATITAAVVNGVEAGTTSWELIRKGVDSRGAGEVMASGANLDTADTTITTGLIANNTYSYWFELTNLNGIAISARITYTPRFKFIIRIR